MLFHVFKRKALCCPKDMSALDDLVHDSVYCLQLSLVLQALRLFPWLLRFPRREKPRRYWTLLCLQQGREAKRSWGEREGTITHVLAVSGCIYHSAGFLGKGAGKGQAPCLVPHAVCRAYHILLLPCHLAHLLSQVWFGLKAFHLSHIPAIPQQNKQ